MSVVFSGSETMATDSDPYLIEAAVRVLDVLEIFRNTGEEATLNDVAARLGLVKSTAFRLLYTLEKKRYIERVPGSRGYRRRRGHRIGFSSISLTIPFALEVNRSIIAAAAQADMELLVAYNEFNAERTIANVDEFVRAGIELLIEYNTDEHVSHIIADRCARANIPVVGITFPVPGGITVGVNNYRAGVTGGAAIGQHVTTAWKTGPQAIVLLDILGNSPTQQARMTGMLDGLREYVDLTACEMQHLHANRLLRNADDLMRKFLNEHKSARRILVLSFNDDNALTALRTVEKCRRSRDVCILSQGGVTAIREELRLPQSAIWGAVAHFPERFGPALMPVVSRILRGDRVPNTVVLEHALLTRSNLGQYYGVPGRRLVAAK
jgi:ribose transport system substrate-binding protein